MKKFKEYALEKNKKEIIAFVAENNIDINSIDIDFLIESGWWDGVKRGLTKGAFLAAMPAISGANWMPTPELPNPQPYYFSAEKLMDNQQKQKDRAADGAYINAGGPEFKQTLEDAEKYLQFQRTKENQDILRRAGLPSDYIPSPVRSFAYGDRISTASAVHKEEVKIIENEVKRHFGRDSFVRLVKSEDSLTGGGVMLLDITGTIMAFDENDAVKRVETVVQQIAKNNGYDLAGFQDTSKHGTNVRPAPRSTIDFVQQENNGGRPIKFSVRIKLLVPK